MRAPPYNPAQSKRGSNVDEDEMRGDDEFGRRCDERDVRRRFGGKQGCAVDQEAGGGTSYAPSVPGGDGPGYRTDPIWRSGRQAGRRAKQSGSARKRLLNAKESNNVFGYLL